MAGEVLQATAEFLDGITSTLHAAAASELVAPYRLTWNCWGLMHNSTLYINLAPAAHRYEHRRQFCIGIVGILLSLKVLLRLSYDAVAGCYYCTVVHIVLGSSIMIVTWLAFTLRFR
ncbi:hypothetical protein BDW68DRAFT_85742 [Aspergillus falconensis]